MHIYVCACVERDILKMLYHHGRHLRPRAQVIQGQSGTNGSIENTTTTTLLYTMFTMGCWHSKRSHAIRSILSFKCWQLWLCYCYSIYCHLIQSIELLSTNMGARLWLNGETLERTPTPLLANLEGSPPMGILFTSHDYNTSYSLANHTL